MKSNINFYSTSNYRLASSLIANNFQLQGIIQRTVLGRRQYVFENTNELQEVLLQIESGKDSLSSIALYTAYDFLTKEITKEAYRKEIEQEVFNLTF